MKLAGYQGEKTLIFPLSFIDDKKYSILHDLRLYDGNHYFQIDVLILSKKFALIVEVKNYAGELYFDTEFNQLIRTLDSTASALPYPLTQIKRLQEQLNNWLSQYISIPLYSLVVVSNPTAFIRTNSKDSLISQQIIHQSYLPFQINKIDASISSQSISDKDLTALIKALKKQNKPLNVSILKKFSIEKEEMIKGVICNQCSYRPLERINANWYCPLCKSKSKIAHIYALKDYYYLFGKIINNKQARDFLEIQSSALATRIMSKIQLKRKGTRKDNEYYLDIKTLNKLTKGESPCASSSKIIY